MATSDRNQPVAFEQSPTHLVPLDPLAQRCAWPQFWTADFPTPDFVEVLTRAKTLGCKDNRDRIYAFLGSPKALVGERKQIVFVPDYGRSCQEVYHDFAASWLEPSQLAVHDRCYIVAGMPVPVILRPQADSDDQYHFLGDFFVFGIMHGELFDKERAEGTFDDGREEGMDIFLLWRTPAP